jgi:hypothetical protein
LGNFEEEPTAAITSVEADVQTIGEVTFNESFQSNPWILDPWNPRTLRAPILRICYGVAGDDFDEWHVGIRLRKRLRKQWLIHNSSPDSINSKSSPDTALRDITDLVKRGILVREAGGGRSTSYSLAKVE